MIEQDHELLSLRISTGGDKQSVEAFCEIFARAILRIEMEPLCGRALNADLTLRALPGFGLGVGTMSPSRNSHTGNLVDSDDIVLVCIREGYSEFEWAGRRIEAGRGDVVVTSAGEAAAFTTPTDTQVTNLRFRRASLMPYLTDLGATLSTPKLKPSPALDLLLDYANVLEDGEALSSPALRRSVVAHLHEIAALAMGASGDGAQIAVEHGVRAARLHAIKADIRNNLAHQSLSAGMVAQRHGITQRYVHKLFEQDGTTFSAFVIARRLERARGMLADPQYAERTISSIAYEAGFGDLSYFNRTFKRRFGETPSDVRQRQRSAPWRGRLVSLR